MELVQHHAQDPAHDIRRRQTVAARDDYGHRTCCRRGRVSGAVLHRAVDASMKRSNEQIFWSLFGAGGMLAALIGPALVFITGIAVPFGLMFKPDTMSYAHLLAFSQSWVGK